MKLDSLETLLVEELRDLYNAERQILKALPKMAKAASSPNLKRVSRNICSKPKPRWNVSTRSLQIWGSRQKVRSVKPWRDCSRRALNCWKPMRSLRLRRGSHCCRAES